jgi:hypothetical protein
VEDPKIMITTSRDPSSKLKQFAKVNPLQLPEYAQETRETFSFFTFCQGSIFWLMSFGGKNMKRQREKRGKCKRKRKKEEEKERKGKEHEKRGSKRVK